MKTYICDNCKMTSCTYDCEGPEKIFSWCQRCGQFTYSTIKRPDDTPTKTSSEIEEKGAENG